MPQNPKANASTNPTSAANGGNAQALETSIRQLLANGNSKGALEHAKQFHKAQHTTASENLLLEAYKARIQSLLDQNLASEAKSLLELVEERFPNAKALLNEVGEVAAARSGDLAALVEPLNDPTLNAERRAAIEQIIQTQVTDLRALADCSALPPEHSLRQAAAALDRAFDAVTSGPVTEEQVALPEVSHRSPLASWKLLVRAIACLHRNEDRQCRDYLAAIKPESVPARLIRAIHAILGGSTNGTPLKPAERVLVSRVSANLTDLRAALEQVDRAFAADNDGAIFKALHTAVRECQRSAPERLALLKQIAHVRGETTGLDTKPLNASLEGQPPRDAAYLRMFARAMETSSPDDPDDLAEACEIWDEFRRHAVSEDLFAAQSIEVAVLYLHMADTLGQLSSRMLKELQSDFGFGPRRESTDERYYLYPDKLFARACTIDPHAAAFGKWLSWANRQSAKQAEAVAKEWHRLRPGDIEPLLHLMKQAEKRNAFPSAIGYLEKAERIDAVHSVVRAARLRLLAAAALSQLQKKKPHLAAERIAEMANLPQSQQGDRPAFLAALRALNGANANDQDGMERSIDEVKALLGAIPAGLLLFGLAAAAKRLDLRLVPDAKDVKPELRESVPAALARVIAIAKDFGIGKFSVPHSYIFETEKIFPRVAERLDTEQIRELGDLGIAVGNHTLAWIASTAGLKRLGPTQAFFLLMRAQALPPACANRKMVLAAAAAELARSHRETEVLDKAVDMLHSPFGDEPVSMTLEQALEIARKEAATPNYPTPSAPGPDYTQFLPDGLCQCPNCRRRRGEIPDLLEDEDMPDLDEMPDAEDFEDFFATDDSEMRKMFKKGLPKGTPPDLANSLFEILKESLRTGESPEKLLSDLLGGLGGSKQNKGRSKK